MATKSVQLLPAQPPDPPEGTAPVISSRSTLRNVSAWAYSRERQ
jgi:hypothetical protein